MKNRGRYIKAPSPEAYREGQIKTYKKKAKHVWVSETELRVIADHVKDSGLVVHKGICHGVRTGHEVHRLRYLLGADIIGTEIAATDHEYVIEWDFHEVKPEWIGAFDFIYSNSWDHSYDFELILKQWMSCLTERGRCFLEWSGNHAGPENTVDCFGIPFNDLVALINEDYEVETVLKVPGRYVIVAGAQA